MIFNLQALQSLVSCIFSVCESVYTVADELWDIQLGNHRAVILVKDASDYVLTDIRWRRHDRDPEDKAVILIDAQTGKRVMNMSVIELTQELGRIVFQPETTPGKYYAYYMPYRVDSTPWHYVTEYLKPETTADPDWLKGIGDVERLPKAEVTEIQARTDFDSFYPMELIATRQEVDSLMKEHRDQDYLLFPESREYPIRMTDYIPLRWVEKGPGDSFFGEAQRDEFFVFQVGVYPIKADIDDIDVEFGELVSDKMTIPSTNFRCFNKNGIDWLGRPMSKTVKIFAKKVGALWFGVQVPRNAEPGEYKGHVLIKPHNFTGRKVNIFLKVSDEVAPDHGDDDLWRLSRLGWLDSTIGIDDEVTSPYVPLKVDGLSVELLGRRVSFAENGLPVSIMSGQREILHGPVRLDIVTSEGSIALPKADISLKKVSNGTVIWNSISEDELLWISCESRVEFDGFLDFRLSIRPKSQLRLEDIALEIPLRRDIAIYMMGMGCKGGYRPREWSWVWNENYANNTIWIGDVEAGLYCKLKGTENIWELYSLKAEGVPKDWDNDHKGGCKVFEDGDKVILRAYSGDRVVTPGDELNFCFSLIVTPLKPLNPDHWNQRYYHAYVPIDTVKQSGANIVNIHHGNELNPNINYPFLSSDRLHEYVREAHNKGIKVKIYYTVRELSNYVAEMWALRSLGDEIFTDGPGGGHSWLCEHLGSHYLPAWHHTFPDGRVDAAIATKGLSRWHNYYLEGLRWLIKNVGIDGLYLDGIGYDREIMKRVRKVLDRERPGSLIDFHSGNNFAPQYGMANCATQYMEHFPYIDSLWFGEGFDYNEAPDYWLVEISGIPFGLYGEMLEGGGNPWRGMLYGMTNRLGWSGDPRSIWKLWDEFGIQDSQMIGYWDKNCPVKTDRDDVLATVYCKKGKSLLVIASWAKEPVKCRLNIDWDRLGIEKTRSKLVAPEVAGLQDFNTFDPSEPIIVEPGRGWFLIISQLP